MGLSVSMIRMTEMREIKFRAWQSVLKIMDYSPDNSISFDGKIVNFGNTDITGYNDNIMQYTGLKDNNGKEIYEGDFLGVDGGGKDFPCPVSWDIVQAQWVCEVPWLKNKLPNKYVPIASYVGMSFCEVEVIGNIYENPELLTPEDSNEAK